MLVASGERLVGWWVIGSSQAGVLALRLSGDVSSSRSGHESRSLCPGKASSGGKASD